MYIANVKVKNYRNLKEASIDFHEGTNVIIGHNNAGKSNLLSSIGLIFDKSSRKQLDVEDFSNEIQLDELKEKSPTIQITVLLKQSQNENLMGDELVTVSDWLVSLKEPYEAQIQYEFFLPTTEDNYYMERVKSLTSVDDVWKMINADFIRFYTYKILVGNPANQISIGNESINKFDYQFLNAIRDVERDMFSGKNTLLKSVIDFFMDYEIKANKGMTEEDQRSQIQLRKKEFSNTADDLIEKLKIRLASGNKEILSYASDIGASFDKSEPSFSGKITESEIYSVLQLIVKQETGMTIPVARNGLGYNNLIFMSLLLAKMQVDSDGKYLGSNAKVFPMLIIEEPEAHLHPTMQDKFMKFLKKNIHDGKVKQIFITTHSTFITAASELDDLICMYKKDNKSKVSYPGKTFINTVDVKDGTNEKSKKYVQRFFDATKSNMLFAEKIILVEGIAELLLIPIMAEYMGISLEDHHVAVIDVGGRYFEHFLNLFDGRNEIAINRKVACITDIDPVRKDKAVSGSSFKKCYPYEYGQDTNKYDYKHNDNLMNKYGENKHPNIQAFSQDIKYGKTLEYQLAHDNPECAMLITDSTSNNDKLKDLMKSSLSKSIDNLISSLNKSDENKRIQSGIIASSWDEEEKKRAIIASRYLNSVGKGENALELAAYLKDNLLLNGTKEYQEFHVPEYIAKAINWVCE